MSGKTKLAMGGLVGFLGLGLLAWFRLGSNVDSVSTGLGESSRATEFTPRQHRAPSLIKVGKAAEPYLAKASGNYGEAIAAIRSATSGSEQQMLLGQLAELAASKGEGQLRQFLDAADLSTSGYERGRLYQIALGKFAEAGDFETALSLADRLGVGQLKSQAVAAIISTWAELDVYAAAVRVSSLEFREEREASLRAITSALHANPQLGMQLLKSSEVDDELKARVAETVGARWEGTVAELLRSVSTLDAGLQSTALVGLSAYQPEDVLVTLIERPELLRPSEINRLVGNIASHDPQSALHTLTQANETDLNRTLMRAVFARWLMQDSIAGSEWLAKVGRSVSPDIKDSLTEHMVGFIARDGDHVSAMEWAKTISDEELRTKLTQKHQK